MVDHNFNSNPIEMDTTGTIYKISSGSGGFKASYESARVHREEDGTYTVKFTTPTNVSTVRESIESVSEAIKLCRKKAGGINKGMPGSGKIDVPEFDYDRIPEE